MSFEQLYKDERIYCDICHAKEIFNPIYRKSSRIRLCVECAREVANLYVYDFECRWIDSDYAEKYGPAPKNKVRRPLPKATREFIFQRDGYTCLHCDAKTDLSIDHIIPVVHGGGDELENLQTLCRVCNSKKGTNLLSEAGHE